MKKRVKIRELMQREWVRGEIVKLFHLRNRGMIHGDDGYDVTFNQESLVVGSYRELSLGLKTTYGIFVATGANVPTAMRSSTSMNERDLDQFGKDRSMTHEGSDLAPLSKPGKGNDWRG